MRILKNYYPSILFCLSMVTAVCIFSIAGVDQGRFCSAEESWVSCARNWVNAAGNILAVIVASVAAYFAFGQLKSARMQAEIANISVLENRIRAANAIDWFASDCMVSAIGMKASLEKICKAFDELNVNPLELLAEFRSVKSCILRIENVQEDALSLMKSGVNSPLEKVLLARLHSYCIEVMSGYVHIRRIVEEISSIEIDSREVFENLSRNIYSYRSQGVIISNFAILADERIGTIVKVKYSVGSLKSSLEAQIGKINRNFIKADES